MQHIWLQVLGFTGLLGVAALLLPVANRLRFPHTVLLAGVGCGLGLLVNSVHSDGHNIALDFMHALASMKISSEVVLFLFLPALVFESALAIDAGDEEKLGILGEIIKSAKDKGIKVILIAEDVTPAALHSLLRQGADEFVPYPLPEGELAKAISRVRAAEEVTLEPQSGPNLKAGAQKDGALIVVHGLAGGVGSTTMAVNLAWELATGDKNAKFTGVASGWGRMTP